MSSRSQLVGAMLLVALVWSGATPLRTVMAADNPALGIGEPTTDPCGEDQCCNDPNCCENPPCCDEPPCDCKGSGSPIAAQFGSLKLPFLDLEFRDENNGEMAESGDNGFTRQPDELSGVGSEDSLMASHLIYRLKENRQVRTGRLQYFDTPYFGALVLVTPISED